MATRRLLFDIVEIRKRGGATYVTDFNVENAQICANSLGVVRKVDTQLDVENLP